MSEREVFVIKGQSVGQTACRQDLIEILEKVIVSHDFADAPGIIDMTIPNDTVGMIIVNPDFSEIEARVMARMLRDQPDSLKILLVDDGSFDAKVLADLVSKINAKLVDAADVTEQYTDSFSRFGMLYGNLPKLPQPLPKAPDRYDEYRHRKTTYRTDGIPKRRPGFNKRGKR